MYYVEILRMEPPFSLLTDDGYASGGDPGAHLFTKYPIFNTKHSIAVNCSTDAGRMCPSSCPIPRGNICNSAIRFERLFTKLVNRSQHQLIIFYGYSIDAPLIFRQIVQEILNVDSPKDMTSIVVITDNIERHSLDFNIQFDESIGTTKEHYCPRCRQIRSPMLYVVNLRDPTKGTSFSDERCEACKNLRWKDLPAGGFKLEDSDELLTRDIPVYCTACDIYMADYFSGVDRFLNENAIERYSGDDGAIYEQYVYCSKKCRKRGKKHNLQPTACSYCAKSGSNESSRTKACGGCEKIYYCSVRCQRADWGIHKKECHPYREMRAKIVSESVD